MQGQILGLINPAIALLFAACFVFLWRRDPKSTYVAALAVGYAMLAAGFLTFHFMPDADAVATTIVMHSCYSLSASALIWGVCQRSGVRIGLPVLVTICAIAAVALVAAHSAPNQLPRIFAANACYGLIFALGAQSLSRSGKRNAIDRLILWLIVITAFQFFARPYITFLFEQAMSTAEYRDSTYYSITIVSVAVMSLMLAMALVAACIVDQMNALKAETERDLLTGLLVRKAFEEEAVALLDRAQRAEVPVCAIVADIDHFKQVNDIWGHQAGDNGISCFGRLIADTVRDTDPVGRIGGEEFCILVWNCEEDAAGRLADRIRRQFTKCPVEGMQDDVRLTASFGVAQWRAGEGYGKLFARADAALYRAKDDGRDCVRVGQAAKQAVGSRPDVEAA